MGRKKNKPEWQDDALNMVRALKAGEIVVHSTDTVWGIGANANNAESVKRIFAIKERPLESTLLMLVDSPGMLEKYLPKLPDSAWDLIEVSDRPVTIIAPCSDKAKADLAPGLVAKDGTLAVRLVHDDYVAFIIRGLGAPLASTSANQSGKPTPDSFGKLQREILDRADAIANYRRNAKPNALASMMVKFDEHNRITVIRS
jgi:L-threonylcarbamoyladenylate synthase